MGSSRKAAILRSVREQSSVRETLDTKRASPILTSPETIQVFYMLIYVIVSYSRY